MKRAGICFCMAAFIFSACSNKEKKSGATGLPGDNLDLYAVLDLFKSSSSVEDFEKKLNSKSSSVNNLDLNGDSVVDYIRVVDKREGDDHAITLRVPVSKEESQDVAVIEIEKTGDKQASIQIIGDEDIYGKNMIVEPKENAKAGFVYASTAIGVNVWFWPSVAYVYEPDYVVWESPYYYDYYPVYYDPWPPVAYEVYYPVVYAYHAPYVVYDAPRFRHAHEIYYSNRVSSGFVMGRERHGDFREGRQEHYGPRGGPAHDGNRAMPGARPEGNPGAPNRGFGGNNGRENHPANTGPRGNNGNARQGPAQHGGGPRGNAPGQYGGSHRGANPGAVPHGSPGPRGGPQGGPPHGSPGMRGGPPGDGPGMHGGPQGGSPHGSPGAGPRGGGPQGGPPHGGPGPRGGGPR